jgi:hypothetical protein
LNEWDRGLVLVSHDFRLINQMAKEIVITLWVPITKFQTTNFIISGSHIEIPPDTMSSVDCQNHTCVVPGHNINTPRHKPCGYHTFEWSNNWGYCSKSQSLWRTNQNATVNTNPSQMNNFLWIWKLISLQYVW